VPVLGDDVGPDDLTIVAVDGGHELHYYDHRFPLAPGTVADGDAVQRGLHPRSSTSNWRNTVIATHAAGNDHETPARDRDTPWGMTDSDHVILPVFLT